MRLEDLARQLKTDSSTLLAEAKKLGLPVADVASSLTASDEWQLRAATATQAASYDVRRPLGTPPPGRPVTQRRQDRRTPNAPVSDLVRIFLVPLEAADQADAEFNFRRPTPRRVLIARAEAQARDWAHFWFTAQDVKDWLAHHPRIQPTVAAALRDAGLTPHQATVNVRTPRGFVHRLPISIRVAAGEITAQEAAAELRVMNDSWTQRRPVTDAVYSTRHYPMGRSAAMARRPDGEQFWDVSRQRHTPSCSP